MVPIPQRTTISTGPSTSECISIFIFSFAGLEKVAIIALICAFPLMVRSQSNSIFLVTNFTFPSVYSHSVPELVGFSTKDGKVSITPEIGYKYSLSKRINVKASLLIEERGWHSKISTIDTSTGTVSSPTKANYAYIFLTSPLRIEYTIGKKHYCFVNSGINISLRTGGGIRVDENSSLPLTLIIPDVKRPSFDFSLSLSGGVGIPISTRVRFYFEGTYFHGLTVIGKYSLVEELFYHRGYRVGFGVDIKVHKKNSEHNKIDQG